MASPRRINGTPIDSSPAQAICAAAAGRWARRSELADLANVPKRSADFYVRALYLAGRLTRRKIPFDHNLVAYAYQYRQTGT